MGADLSVMTRTCVRMLPDRRDDADERTQPAGVSATAPGIGVRHADRTGLSPRLIAQLGRPSVGGAMGKPVRRKRSGGGPPPHWLSVVGLTGQLRAW